MTLPTMEAAAGQSYWGKFPGRVTDNQDPVNRGRIQVEVPGIRQEDPAGGADSSTAYLAWAVPCLPPGFFVIPDVDALVWVEFGGGDLDYPIWTGVWYRSEGTPQNVDGEYPTPEQKVIRTTSGQVIQLEDTEGEERTILRDEANDHRVTMDAEGIRLEDAHGNRVVMDADGIRVEDAAGNALTLTASGIVAAESGGRGVLALEASQASLALANRELVIAADGTTLSDKPGMAAQPIVLAPIYQWLATHMHTGNMGAPTPVMPVPLIATYENLLGIS
jgi:hypothetical protein